MVFGQINTFSPNNAMLITTMRMTFIAENIAIVLNIILLTTFYYQIEKEKKRIENSYIGTPTKDSNIIKKRLQWEAIYVTWTLLIVGFIFSLSQGLIENFLTPDCTVLWLQCLTFFFYAAHRSLLLFSCLHRLYFVFKDSAYSYPKWFYYFLFVLIVIHFIGSYIIYVIDHGITVVDIGMFTGFSGTYLCSWSFGVLFSGVQRPFEMILQILLVIAFLYKLWYLHRLIHKATQESNQVNKLLVIFRKVTFLSIAALITTVIVTFGYINFKPFAFGFPLDAVFNSFCVFLMFQFNQIIIKPCFGMNCDRLCCIKFEGICKCKYIKCHCYEKCYNLCEYPQKDINGETRNPQNINHTTLPSKSSFIDENNNSSKLNSTNSQFPEVLIELNVAYSDNNNYNK